MKRNLWLSIGFMLVGQMPVLAAGSGIELLSQEHHVWGWAGSTEAYVPGGTAASYDQRSSAPLDVSVSGSYMAYPLAFGAYPMPQWAHSRAGDFSVWTESATWFGEAQAESTYVFMPQTGVQALTFGVDCSGCGVGINYETNTRFTLDDLTAGVRITSLAEPHDSDWGNHYLSWWHDRDNTYPVDPAHTYSMTLFAHAGYGDDIRGSYLVVDVLPTAIPAPGALLLVVIGTALVGGLRGAMAGTLHK